MRALTGRGRRAAPEAGRRLRLMIAGAGVLVIAAVGTFALTASIAGTVPDPVPLDGGLIRAVSAAATSCRALTPARLAGQIMATTGFSATPASGISGLSAEQWAAWKPADESAPADPAASTLALAHLTCDLIGRIRVAALPGDPWRLAAVAVRTSLADIAAAGGIPAQWAAFADNAEQYAAAYEAQLNPDLATTPPVLAAGPTTPSLTTTPSAVATTAPRSPTDPPPGSANASPTRTSAPRTSLPTLRPPGTLSYSTITDPSALWLNGSARLAGGRLDLTTALTQAGSAWSTTAVDTRRSLGTSFTALISAPADGVAFVIQAAGPTALGAAGGGLGYAGQIRPSLAVELDTWDNSPDGYDPPGHQHIAITVNGDNTNHLIWADPGFDMAANRPVYLWVGYDVTNKFVTVFAAQTSTKPATSLFAYPVDLRTLLGTDQAYVGFTGGTGASDVTGAHESILAWTSIPN